MLAQHIKRNQPPAKTSLYRESWRVFYSWYFSKITGSKNANVATMDCKRIAHKIATDHEEFKYATNQDSGKKIEWNYNLKDFKQFTPDIYKNR